MEMPQLKKGDQIGIIATARKVSLEELKPCTELLNSWGLEVIHSPNLFCVNNQFAGIDDQRAQDLQWAIDHPTLKAIIVARGGYGTSKIIDLIDFSNFSNFPKWFIGFSDVTVLISQLVNENIPSIHGPVALLLNQDGGEESASRLKNLLLENKATPINAAYHLFNKKGTAKAKLVGGNLSILHTLLDTPSDIETENTILFLEDLDEYLYHIDRMMVHLDRAGKLKNLAGLVVGHMSDMNDNKIPYGLTAYEIINQHCSKYDYPIAFGIPIGHENNNHPVISGIKYILEVSEHGSSLTRY